MNDERQAEVELKIERVVGLCNEADVKGILLGLQPSFSWLTAGGTNRIDGSREPGAGALLITADGRRFVVANNIESGRLVRESVAGLPFEVAEYPWLEERTDAALAFRTAVRLAGGVIGSDVASPEAKCIEPAIARLRSPLMRGEIGRYRQLGADAGRLLGDVMTRMAPGTTEKQATGAVAAALASMHIRPIVLLAAGDRRIAQFRHPVPTDARWTERLLVGTCAERDGLIVALSRMIITRNDDDLAGRVRAATSAFAAMLNATKQSATGANIFNAASGAYAAAGFPGEEAHHHQGGAIGYRAREWVAHPASEDVVALPQAFAWNPTVRGTKVEETCLVHEDGRVEVITTSPGWPSIAVNVRGSEVRLPDVYCFR
jgi:Xaa-Pro dipeptidase